MNFSPCVVIPIYNHKDTIAHTVESLRQYDIHCFIVDDGSDAATKAVLAALAGNDKQITLLNFPHNIGKGGAVIAGLKLAYQQGYTHALQIDADGQHNVGDVPIFLQLAAENPDALICGQPIFDESAPLGRKLARYITHFWVCVETLSLKIRDTMCGFRLYPLNATIKLLSQRKLGLRMDFDTEIMVHLIWMGVAVVPIATKVKYPEKGISHFRYLHDNLLIIKMHTLLVMEMLARLPFFIIAKLFPQQIRQYHWARINERGSQSGLNLLFWLYKVLGSRVVEVFLWPVILYFFITDTQSRQASKKYLDKVYRVGPQNSRLAQQPTALDTFKHFLEFGGSCLDKISSWMGQIKRSDIDFENSHEFYALAKTGRGGVVVGSHLGNIELCRALANDIDDIKLNILLFNENAEKFNRILTRTKSKTSHTIISVNEIGPDTAILLKEKVDRGEIIVVLGDRVAVNSTGRINYVDFLGDRAPFAQGPFILASLLDCPVYLMFCLKESRRYRVYFEHFAERIVVSRKNRKNDLQKFIQEYACRLEYYCLLEPFQWFNFYDYWQQDV